MPEKSLSRRSIIIISLILAVVCAYLAYEAKNYTLDDALIYYRYIENAIEGNGLVYNAGEKFNGLTSPFYTYISLIAAFIFRDIPATQTVMSALFLFLASFTALKILNREKLSAAIVMIPPLMIVSARFFYLTFGMETPLFMFLAMLNLYLFMRKKYFLLGIFAGIMFLTRGESLFLILSLLIFYWIRHKKLPDWKIFIIPVLLVLGNYTFNYFYYGDFLPHTLSAKIQQGGSGLWRTWPFFRVKHIIIDEPWSIYGSFSVYLFPLLVLISIIGVFFNFTKSLPVRILSIFLVFYTLFYSILQVPAYPWYYTIYYLCAMIFAGYGLNSIYNFFKKGLPGTETIGKWATAFFFLILFIPLFTYSFMTLEEERGNLGYKEAALWIKENTSPDAKIACVEIGHIGWYSDRYIIDILGLVNPYNAEFIGNREFSRWMDYYEPDYIFLHDPLWVHEVGMKPLLADSVWVPVEGFDVEGYSLVKIAD